VNIGSIPDEEVVAAEPNPISKIANTRDADDDIGSTKSTTCAKNNNESMIPPI
jgi:hypothetical protein